MQSCSHCLSLAQRSRDAGAHGGEDTLGCLHSGATPRLVIDDPVSTAPGSDMP